MIEVLLQVYWVTVGSSPGNVCHVIWSAYKGRTSLTWGEVFTITFYSFIPILNFIVVADFFVPMVKSINRFLKSEVFKRGK